MGYEFRDPEPRDRNRGVVSDRSPLMTPRRVVALLIVALLVYLVVIGYRGVYLLGQHQPALKVLGAAVLIFPLIGVWVVLAEVRFGRATERMARALDAEGAELEPELPRTPAGRIDRVAADAYFDTCKLRVEADPQDWRGWYLLARAYDYAGDRRRARAAMRTAIERFTATPR